MCKLENLVNIFQCKSSVIEIYRGRLHDKSSTSSTLIFKWKQIYVVRIALLQYFFFSWHLKDMSVPIEFTSTTIRSPLRNVSYSFRPKTVYSATARSSKSSFCRKVQRFSNSLRIIFPTSRGIFKGNLEFLIARNV